MAAQRAFQFDDGGSNPTSPLFVINRIGHREAKHFIEIWHYSARMPTGKNVCFGLWKGSDLYAVIVYGIGVNPYQAAFLGVEQVVEIKRMARKEPKEDYSLSRFIRLSERFLRGKMTYQAVVAFADPEHGHTGTVYKAAGFEHCGMTNAEWHLLNKAGEVRHRRFAFRMARRNGISLDEARKQLGLTRVKTMPKHRWVLKWK